MSEESTHQESAWLWYTDGEYYNRTRAILLKYGMGEADVELILWNTWENGYCHGKNSANQGD